MYAHKRQLLQLGGDNNEGREGGVERERWGAPQMEGPHQNISTQVSTNLLLAMGSVVLQTARDTQRLECPLS